LFGGLIFDQWVIHGVLGPKTSLLHADPIDYWARRITEILPPATDLRLSTLASLQTVCQLQSLLADLLANNHPPTAERDAAWFEQACALLEELPFRGQAAVARQLGTTADCFRKRFQKIAGVAPSHYRKAHLIDRACAMLQENRLRDHEIADALGFHDAAHFSKYFKAHNGQTPTAFRRAQPVTPR
jgi:AraC-like DNA-binding protein